MTDEPKQRRAFFDTAPLRAAQALQKALPIDESGSRFAVGHGQRRRARLLPLRGDGRGAEGMQPSFRWARFRGDADGEPGEPQNATAETTPLDGDDPRRPHFERLMTEAVIDDAGERHEGPALSSHACACIMAGRRPSMRTTIEITPEHRAKLLALAARRGAKGFSQLVAEALDAYLRAEADREAQRTQAGRLKGALPAREAQALRDAAAALRTGWR
jgi:hypothetical protein